METKPRNPYPDWQEILQDSSFKLGVERHGQKKST